MKPQRRSVQAELYDPGVEDEQPCRTPWGSKQLKVGHRKTLGREGPTVSIDHILGQPGIDALKAAVSDLLLSLSLPLDAPDDMLTCPKTRRDVRLQIHSSFGSVTNRAALL